MKHKPTHPLAIVDTATLALLAAWQAEDATTDPDLLRAATGAAPVFP